MKKPQSGPTPPQSDDVISHLLETFRLNARVFQTVAFCGDWALDTSGSGQASFHVVAEGACWLQIPGEDAPVQLGCGDLVLFPRDAAHVITGQRETQVAVNAGPMLRYQNAPKDAGAGLVCGFVEFLHQPRNPLLDALPDYLHIAANSHDQQWLSAVLSLLRQEAHNDSTGRDAVINKLCDLLFIHAIRAFLRDKPQVSGVLAAVGDRKVAAAMKLMHQQPERAWTVAELGEQVGMSRSAFAEHFSRITDLSPLDYLTRWRMYLAARWLAEERLSVFDVAQRVGYKDEAAFRKAFKRHANIGPGEVRRSGTLPGPDGLGNKLRKALGLS